MTNYKGTGYDSLQLAVKTFFENLIYFPPFLTISSLKKENRSRQVE
jgi:hypothetical protein